MTIRPWKYIIIGLLVLGDLACYNFSISFIGVDAPKALQSPWIAAFLFGMIISFAFSGCYSHQGLVSRIDEAAQIIKSLVILTMIVILVGIVSETSLYLGPRGWVKLVFIFGLVCIGYRWLFRSAQKWFFRYNIGTQRTLIVGRNPRSEQVYQQIRSRPKLGYNLLGFVDEPVPNPDSSLQPVVGDISSLPQLIHEMALDEVIIALEKPEHEALLNLMSTINGHPIEIKILPDMYEAVTGLAKTEHVYGLPLIRINPDFITPLEAVVKRACDVLLSGLAIIIGAPFFMIIAIINRLTSPGPAIFTQERVGYRGKRFMMHKFRTMVDDAEQHTGPVWARSDDPRITSFGRLLRRFRLDELPQIWNVLRGDMSLVGPRPERPAFVEWLMQEFPYYHRRLLVRPGISGWAQVRGVYDRSLDDVRRKLKDDFFYIENMSLRLDLKILLITVWVVLSGKGH
ncbi:sugar transferase [Candidatus Neomarinimicrobiota bacterium]